MVRDVSQANELRALGAEVVYGDIQKEETLAPVVHGITGVYHIAAIYRQAGLPEEVFYDINAAGTRRMLDAAVKAGVPRFIHCSTVGVLGNVENPPANESAPFNPGDMYQRSKLEGEKIALEYFRAEKIRGLVIRPAIIYGPGDTRTAKIFRMIARRQFFYVGKGEKHVHWIDVRDLVRAFQMAMARTDLNGEVFIIAGEKSVPLKKMIELIATRLNVPQPRLHLPVKPIQLLGTVCELLCTPFRINPPIYRRRVDFYTKNRHFDGSKAATLLGFTPAQPFEEELRTTRYSTDAPLVIAS
jgi:nucleoside-diphosphate-sugar epimerase